MPRIYRSVRRPVTRAINPLLLPQAPAQPEPDPEPEPRAVVFSEPLSEELTLKELQERADAAGLPTYGTKAQLIARLSDDG